MRLLISIKLLVVIILAATHLSAAELIGAEALLKNLSETSQNDSSDGAGQQKEEHAFLTQLKKFKADKPQMDPTQAAEAWMTLVEQYIEAKDNDKLDDVMYEKRPVNLQLLVQQIPGPESWPLLLEKIDALPATDDNAQLRQRSLRLMVLSLLGNQGTLEAQFRETRGFLDSAKLKSNGNEAKQVFGASIEKYRALQNPYEYQLTLFKKYIEDKGSNSGFSGRYYYDYNYSGGGQIPDLLKLTSEDEARALIVKALTEFPGELELPEDPATRKLVLQLALEHAGEMTKPKWGLCQSLDAMELYESLKAQAPAEETPKPVANAGFGADGFGDVSGLVDVSGFMDGSGFGIGDGFGGVFESSSENESYNIATVYYFLALVAKGRTDEARSFAEANRDIIEQVGFFRGGLQALVKAGYQQQTYDYFKALLADAPDEQGWLMLIQLGAEVGRSDEIAGLIETALKADSIDEDIAERLNRYLMTAYLAAGKVEEGIAILKQEYEKDPDLDIALKIGQIGALTDRRDWVDEAMGHIRKLLAESTEDVISFNSEEIVDFLNQQDQLPLLEDYYLRMARETLANGASNEYYFDNDQLPQYMQNLADIYDKSGREEDVLVLVDQSPYWNKRDLKGFVSERISWYDASPRLGFIVAKACLKTGRTEPVSAILRTLLVDDDGYDDAYELLVKHEGEKALPFLEKLAERNRFEERPLIWKARILLDQGKAAQARETVTAAIAIDPSDGEQGPDRRMRAYAVLADIYAALGDAEQENLYREVVRSIRISEEADKFHAAGLLGKAIEMYHDALTHFSDAYCIQSRLAIQLSQAGRLDEAEKYFQRAFELMPDSFGRMESHCFGCEGVFSTPLAQSIAEKTFNQLLTVSPNDPKIHYLLGYLKSSEDENAAAYTHFREAVKLDPDYINAWTKLNSLRYSVPMDAEFRDQIAMNLLRLDPCQINSSPNFAGLTNFSLMWKTVANLPKFDFELPDEVMPLPASIAMMDKVEKAMKEAGQPSPFEEDDMTYYGFGYQRDGALDPGNIIASNELIQIYIRLFEMSMQSGYYYF